MRFMTLYFKIKLITSESPFRKGLCVMVVYKVLMSKDEIDLAFSLTFISFSLMEIEKDFCATQNFLQPE